MPGGMGTNNRANRAKKKAARERQERARNERLRRQAEEMTGLGWHTVDDLDGDDLPAPPDDALLSTDQCPVDATCRGCGAATELRVVTAALTAPGGYEVGCTTLCGDCDGRSLLQLLGPAGFSSAVEHHATH